MSRSGEEWFFSLLSNDDIWKELRRWMFPNKKSYNFYDYQNGDTAIYYNYLSLMKSKKLIYSKQVQLEMDKVIEQGNIKMVKFLYKNNLVDSEGYIPNITITYGQLKIAKLLYFRFNLMWNRNAIEVAAENGQIKFIKLLHNLESNGADIKFTKNAIDLAAVNGHLEVVQFLDEFRTEGCTTLAMDKAAANGHIHVVRYLQDSKLGISPGCTVLAMTDAILNGHINIACFLRCYRTEGCKRGLIERLLYENRVNGVRFLCTKMGIVPNAKMFRTCIKNGKYEIVKFFVCELKLKYTQNYIDLAKNYGRQDITQVLTENLYKHS